MDLIIGIALPVLFLAALFLGDIYIATAVLMATLTFNAAWYWIQDGKPHKLHTTTAIVAVVLGALTLLLRDADFVKYKPTVMNALLGTALLLSHIIGDKVLLARIPQKTIVLPDPIWRKVNLAWAGFFFSMSLLNLYVMQNFDDKTWGLFRTFGLWGFTLVFVLAHIPFLGRYLPKDKPNAP